MSKHPDQPVELTNGVIRFKRNKIVDFLAQEKLNDLAMLEDAFPQEEWEQFYQLIGYSVCGYHELSKVSDEAAGRASKAAREIDPEAGGCSDQGCAYHGGPLPK